MAALRTSVFLAPATLAAKLFDLERKGQFDKSVSLLGEIWPDFAEAPDVSSFEHADEAEILLRCGSIVGFHGHNLGLSSPQEASRNLLTRSRDLFLKLNNIEKIAACENYLSLGYWRTGELNEAEAWVETALVHDLPESCDTRLYSFVIRNLIRLGKQEFDEICAEFSLHETIFLQYAHCFLKGSIYNNYGLAVKNLGNLNHSLGVLEIARDYFQQSGNKVYIALAENNLAQIYRQLGNFAEAHLAIDRAAKIFRQIKDKTRSGFSLDTKALIFLEEGRFREALDSARDAIKILKKCDNAAYLTDTMLTRVRILLSLDDFTEAVMCLTEAVDIAQAQIGEEAARKIIREFEGYVETKFSQRIESRREPAKPLESGELSLVMPPELSQFADVQGVWIRNSHLAGLGIERDSLVVVARHVFARGDLVVLRNNQTGEVSSGIYDADFGVVCLEMRESEPVLFNETDVTVIGKIIGVCGTETDADDRIIVRPIAL